MRFTGLHMAIISVICLILSITLTTTTTRLAAVEQQIAEINEFHHDLFDPEPEIAHGKLIPLEDAE